MQDYIETLVHPSAQHDALAAARHRAFIAPRLLGSMVGLASFPLYLIARGAPSASELMILAWLVVPILIAYFLSRTGRYESAHALSSLALTGLVTAVAISTGGITSFAAVWLVIVPLEASLSASRRVVTLASTFALGAAGLLALLGSPNLPPMPYAGAPVGLAALGIVSGALFAAALALGAETLAGTRSWLLHGEEDRYQLLARNMTDVAIRHGRDGAVLFVSPAAESLLGCPVAELQGQGLFGRVHVADRPAYLSALGDAAALGKCCAVEFRARRDRAEADAWPPSEFVWIEMRCRPIECTPVQAEGRERYEVVAVLRDVTERKMEVQALEDARLDSDRDHSAKSRFLATMSHELRTPLNAIIGFSDMLKKESVLRLDEARRSEYAGLINDSGHHLLAVINSILDISRIETGNFEITPEPFMPSEVVGACCDLLALRAGEAGVDLKKITPGDLPEIIADKRAVNQILLNLVSNAIRFTDRGGEVTISLRAEATAVIFMVEDNGVGIRDEDLARVGEPYFQGHGTSSGRRHGGTGLGLSIVKGLVRLHGGEMSIRSRVDEGTRVAVCLPLDCERARPARNTNAQGVDGTTGLLPASRSGDLPTNVATMTAREQAASPRDIWVKKSA